MGDMMEWNSGIERWEGFYSALCSLLSAPLSEALKEVRPSQRARRSNRQGQSSQQLAVSTSNRVHPEAKS